MARSISIEVKESAKEIKALLKKNYPSVVEQRLLMLDAILKGVSSTNELAKICGVNRDTITNWKNLYAYSGINAFFVEQRGGDRRSQFTKKEKAALDKVLDYRDFDFESYQDVCDWIKDNLHLEVSIEKIRSYIHKNFYFLRYYLDEGDYEMVSIFCPVCEQKSVPINILGYYQCGTCKANISNLFE